MVFLLQDCLLYRCAAFPDLSFFFLYILLIPSAGLSMFELDLLLVAGYEKDFCGGLIVRTKGYKMITLPALGL